LVNGFDELGEAFTLDQLEHQQEFFGALRNVDRSDHVLVANQRAERGLVREHRNEIGVSGVVCMHALGRKELRFTVGSGGIQVVSKVHRRHTTRGDLVED
jgi:hypothetical protein